MSSFLSVLVCVCVASPVRILGVHVPLYLPYLGTKNCRNLATTSPGRKNVPGANGYLMKLPLRAPSGYLESVEQPKNTYPSRQAVGKQKVYSRAADVHIGRVGLRCLKNNLNLNNSIRQN